MEPVIVNIDSTLPNPEPESRPLRLRPPREADLDTLAKIFEDPQIIDWTLVAIDWDGQARQGYLDAVSAAWRDGSARWVIADEADKVVGTVSVNRENDRSAELVYSVAPWARRGHVALRACHAAASFAFTEMGIARLIWGAKVGNHVSRLIATRLGFSHEGIARAAVAQRGVPIDVWTAAMLPGELRGLDDPPAGYSLSRRRAQVLSAPQPTLATSLPDLKLRPPADADIDKVMMACRDPEVLRWTTITLPYPRSRAEGFVHDYAAGGWRAGTMAVFALADADDQYCGAIDLRLGNPDPAISEIGFNTAPWARGKGYMTAAVRAICEFGFEEFGFTRIEWKAFVGNAGSRRVAEKAGFTVEGTVRNDAVQRGMRVDSWIGAIVKEQA